MSGTWQHSQTCVKQRVDGQTAGCPNGRDHVCESLTNSVGPRAPLTLTDKKPRTPRTERPYLVRPLCGEIPRKPNKKDKHVQMHV